MLFYPHVIQQLDYKWITNFYWVVVMIQVRFVDVVLRMVVFFWILVWILVVGEFLFWFVYVWLFFGFWSGWSSLFCCYWSDVDVDVDVVVVGISWIRNDFLVLEVVVVIVAFFAGVAVASFVLFLFLMIDSSFLILV